MRLNPERRCCSGATAAALAATGASAETLTSLEARGDAKGAGSAFAIPGGGASDSNLISSSSSPSPSIFSAVARREAMATTLLRPVLAIALRGGWVRAAPDVSAPLVRATAGAPGRIEENAPPPVGGMGVSEVRAVDDSLSMALNSGNVRRGTHSSNPSRQTSDSSLINPADALRRSSLRRTGPTGTPLMPTYHSSVLALDDKTAIAAD